jgi:photosystem II stability/assembly factor-like uncharacterized protein
MTTLVKLLTAVLALLSSCEASAQGWVKLDNLPETEFTAIEVIDGTLYTASGTTLYTSSDAGESWEQSLIIDLDGVYVNCFKKFNNIVYAGTSIGIFSAPADDVHGTWTFELNLLLVTSFAEKDNTLYASISGFGILKKSAAGWLNFSAGLPNMSLNADKVVATPGHLFAMGGANGAFYDYDFTLNTWIEDFYMGNIVAGMQMDDALMVNDVLYVSNQGALLRSEDFGDNWTEDQLGLINGANRFMYKGQDQMYVFGGGGIGTRLNRRALNADSGSTWANSTEILPWFTYALCETEGKIFMAAADGVYTNDVTMGTKNPDQQLEETLVYPNPSQNGNFTLQSTIALNGLTIHDVTGRLVMAQDNVPEAFEFSLLDNGLYLVTLTAGKNTKTHKIIVNK